MEQLDYNILYRWFVGFDMEDAVWELTRVHEESRAAVEERVG